MPFVAGCPACRQPILLQEDQVGKAVTCPRCRQSVTAPFPTAVPAPPPPEPEPFALPDRGRRRSQPTGSAGGTVRVVELPTVVTLAAWVVLLIGGAALGLMALKYGAELVAAIRAGG